MSLKDQSGWGFTVKQGATAIHEDSAGLNLQLDNGGGSSHPCPPVGLPQEVTVGPHMPSSSLIQRACYKK